VIGLSADVVRFVISNQLVCDLHTKNLQPTMRYILAMPVLNPTVGGANPPGLGPIGKGRERAAE
jgi:hypothetical protein